MDNAYSRLGQSQENSSNRFQDEVNGPPECSQSGKHQFDPCSWRPDPQLTTEQARRWHSESQQRRDLPIQLDKQGCYRVEFGDSLSQIAERNLKSNGLPVSKNAIKGEVESIVQLNQGRYGSLNCNDDFIRPGWKLKLPCHDRQQPPKEPVPAPPRPPIESRPPAEPPRPPIERRPPVDTYQPPIEPRPPVDTYRPPIEPCPPADTYRTPIEPRPPVETYSHRQPCHTTISRYFINANEVYFGPNGGPQEVGSWRDGPEPYQRPPYENWRNEPESNQRPPYENWRPMREYSRQYPPSGSFDWQQNYRRIPCRTYMSGSPGWYQQRIGPGSYVESTVPYMSNNFDPGMQFRAWIRLRR